MTEQELQEAKADHELVMEVLNHYIEFMHTLEDHEKAKRQFPFNVGDALGRWVDAKKGTSQESEA